MTLTKKGGNLESKRYLGDNEIRTLPNGRGQLKKKYSPTILVKKNHDNVSCDLAQYKIEKISKGYMLKASV